MTKHLILPFMALIGWVSGTTPAFAACGKLTLNLGSFTTNWTESFQTLPLSFYVTKSTGSSNCVYFVTFSDGGASSYSARRMTQGSRTLRYQLYSASNLSPTNILQELPAANQPGSVISGSFANTSGSQRQETFFFDIPYAVVTSPTLPRSGTYSDNFVVKVYEGSLSNPPGSPDDTVTITTTAIVPKIIRISLVGTGAGFDPNSTTHHLNFGTLSTGATQSLDLKVVTNAGYSVKLSSQNNGVLKHANASTPSTVAYSLKVNSVTVNLSSSASSPVEVARGNGQTSLSGNTQTVAVTIGQIANQVAGNYSDVITVTAQTIE